MPNAPLLVVTPTSHKDAFHQIRDGTDHPTPPTLRMKHLFIVKMRSEQVVIVNLIVKEQLNGTVNVRDGGLFLARDHRVVGHTVANHFRFKRVHQSSCSGKLDTVLIYERNKDQSHLQVHARSTKLNSP